MMAIPENSPHLNVYESWQLNLEKDEVRTAWLKAWNSTASITSTGQPIDGLILPPTSNVAHKHGKWPKYDVRFIFSRNLVDDLIDISYTRVSST